MSKQPSGTQIGNSFVTTKDKDGKIRVKPIKGYGQSFTQRLAAKKRAKTPKYGKERG